MVIQRDRRVLMASALAACLLLASCTSQVAETRSSAAAPSEATTPSVGASADASAPADAAPPELAGRWRRSVQGEMVILTLDGSGYHIQRGPHSGNGHISVNGNQIEFSGSRLCDGVGMYTWSFEDERLRMTEIQDPCSGRTDSLLLGTFGRVDE